MKKIILIIFLSFSFFSLFGQSRKEKKEIISEVNKTLNNWHKFAAASDFTHYFDLMDNNGVFVGTDSTEVWTKKEFMKYAKPTFKKKKAWNFTPTTRNIYIGKDPDVVWFDELLNTWMGKCRGSGVLVKKKGRWFIKHYVLSLSVPNDKLGIVKKIINY